MTIRFNPDKAGTTELGYSQVHDIQDDLKTIEQCHDACGCWGVALLAILSVGAATLVGSSLDLASEHCWEVCTYNDLGVGICECLFG